ncbi:DUF2462 domain-containing protein [Aspergillus melleus]|uniref:DUF2462 domain-containing protein n=1 Tax=Aspergillus melleus TaxID=138277 RepID=UPI001E8DDDF3|nr:uncharacterized protein LDX57_005808 [Aspergillus melleus]KAH8428103.1 hypothetical protein LDX57_005808 [Aspergillus melleus]
MVQGSLKKAKANTASTKRYSPPPSERYKRKLSEVPVVQPQNAPHTALGPKPGPRQIAPKKASLVKQKKITKKLTAGLVTRTERSLAERAGHLELLAGGKKDKKKTAEKGKQQGAKK